MCKNILDDWRITGQEDFLMHQSLIKTSYDKDDHEHCIFCWHKFMKDSANVSNCSSDGYCTTDGEYWICNKCYNDFKTAFDWNVIDRHQ